jgi:hypothetical protein
VLDEEAMRIELVRHARGSLGVREEDQRRRELLAFPCEDREVEVVEGDDETNLVLRAQRRERRDVGRVGDAGDDDVSVTVVQGRCEWVRVDTQSDRADSAERTDDVDPLSDGREEHDHDARAYSEDFGEG